MAALLLDIQPGDEVIVPSFTFVSTVNAFVLRGARPVFADIRPDTLNIDERQVERAITPRTRAIVPVHYAGVGCEMDAIGDIAARHGVADRRGQRARAVRALPRTAARVVRARWPRLSFHETKNVTCGEGGALLVNDARLVERAEILREKGTQRSRFFRGQVDKYTWCDVGSSYLPSDMLAAFLLAQLESAEAIQGRAARDLGVLRRAPRGLGAGRRRHAAARAGALRAGVPHVLPAPAVARCAPGAHRPPARPRAS